MKSAYSIQDIEFRLKKYTIYDGDHWLYTNRISNVGYGIIKYLRKQWLVHRLSAVLYLDFDASSSLMVLHKTICSHKNCWNPNHLYIGTHTDNMNDIRSLNKCPKCGGEYKGKVYSVSTNRFIRRCLPCQAKAMRDRRRRLKSA